MTRVWLLMVWLLATATAADISPRTAELVERSRPEPTTPEEEKVEAAFRRLLERDDAAQTEVNKWIDEEFRLREQAGYSEDKNLEARVRQRLDGVQVAYEDFLLLNPKHTRALIAYGSFLNDIGQDHDARARWEKARALDPSNPAVWNNLANYYGHRGPPQKAFEYYEQAIELNSQEPIYYWNLATTMYLFRKDAREHYQIDEAEVFKRSLKLYRQAIKLDPTNFVLASDYAMSFYGIRPSNELEEEERNRQQQATWQEGLTAWTEVLSIAKTPIEEQGVHIHLARLKLNTGDYAGAEAHLSKISEPLYLTLKTRLTKNLETRRSGTTPAEGSPTSAPVSEH